MLTSSLTNQSLKKRNAEHLKTPTEERLRKLITGRKKRITCATGKISSVPWKCPFIHKPERLSEYWTQKGLGTDWYQMNKKEHSDQENSKGQQMLHRVWADKWVTAGKDVSVLAVPPLLCLHCNYLSACHQPWESARQWTLFSHLPLYCSDSWNALRNYFGSNIIHSVQFSKQAFIWLQSHLP